MEYRTLEINSLSGTDLNKVNLITKMDVYVVVSISGGHEKDNQKMKTPVDNDGDTNPTWNFPMKFTVDETAARENRLTLVFKLRCERVLGDKDIGEVHVPIKELLESSGDGKQQFVSYQVRKPSGKPKGQLSFSYKIGDKISGTSKVKSDHEPMIAYPAAAAPPPPAVATSSPYPPPNLYPPPVVAAEAAAGPYPPPKEGGSSGYAPPPAGYPDPAPAAAGYPPPPPAGYGYGYPPPPPYGGYQQPPPPGGYGYPPPPPPGGYGYPPQPGYGYAQPVQQQQQPQKKNKFGMGLGAGLLGGAVGGLLIGDMISDAGSYDTGFADGGFDF